MKNNNQFLKAIFGAMFLTSALLVVSCDNKENLDPEGTKKSGGRLYSCTVMQSDNYHPVLVPEAYQSHDTTGATWCDSVAVEWGCTYGWFFVEFDANDQIVEIGMDNALHSLGLPEDVFTANTALFAEGYSSACSSNDYECLKEAFRMAAYNVLSHVGYFECYSCEGSQYYQINVPDTSRVPEDYEGPLHCYKKGFDFEIDGNSFTDTIFMRVDTLDRVSMLGVGDHLYSLYFNSNPDQLLEEGDTTWNSIEKTDPAYERCKGICDGIDNITKMPYPDRERGSTFTYVKCRIGCRLVKIGNALINYHH